jgi:hypothetical protein
MKSNSKKGGKKNGGKHIRKYDHYTMVMQENGKSKASGIHSDEYDTPMRAGKFLRLKGINSPFNKEVRK